MLLIGGLAYVNHQQEVRLDALSASAVRTVGQITGKQCQNHGRVNYAFEVNGTRYFGEGACTSGFCDAEIGDPVDVIYSKTDPTNFQCESFRAKRELYGGNYFVLLVLTGFIAVGIFQATRTDDVKRFLEERKRRLKTPK